MKINKKRTVIIIALALVTISCYSQSLKINFKGNWSEEIRIQISYPRFVDEHLLSEFSPKSTIIKIPDSISQAMLHIKFLQQDQELLEKDIIWEGTALELSFNIINNMVETSWQQGGINPSYEQFRKNKDSLISRINTFSRLTEFYSDTTATFYKRVLSEREIEFVSLENLTDKYYREFSNSPASQFIYATRNTLPLSKGSKKNQLVVLQRDFFNHYDPLNFAIINSSIYREKLDEYLFLILELAKKNNNINEETMIHFLDEFLYKIKKSNEGLIATAEYMRQLMHQYALDNVEAFLDINYISKQCAAEENDVLQKRLAQYSRLAIGNKAPEIEWISNKGKTNSLIDIAADYCVIIFWASWCEHCKLVLPEVHQYLRTKNNNKVIAIGLDNNHDSWKRERDKYNNWEHIRGAEQWDNKIVLDYAVYATPTFYILDKDKKILGKCKNLTEIKKIL